jgi:hypothetical protein
LVKGRKNTVKLYGKYIVEVKLGDITEDRVEAITNAANGYLAVRKFRLC